MADTKISDLPEKTTGITGTEDLVIADTTSQKLKLNKVVHEVDSKAVGTSINIVAHSVVNSVSVDSSGSGILSGGSSGPGGENKITGVNSDWSVISGGYDNDIAAQACVIAGGAHHNITATAGHGTVGGGSTNSLTGGEYNTISGGGGATLPNSIDGERCVIGGGSGNQVTGASLYATIPGGRENTVSADYGTCVGGYNNTVVAQYGATMGGFGCQVTANGGMCLGGNSSIASEDNAVAIGTFVNSAVEGGIAMSGRRNVITGDAQAIFFNISNQTTDGTLTRLVVAGSGTFAKIPDESCWVGRILIAAREHLTKQVSSWEANFVCQMNAGTASLVSENWTQLVNQIVLSDPFVDIQSGGFFRVAVVGSVGKNIDWSASVSLTQIIGS